MTTLTPSQPSDTGSAPPALNATEPKVTRAGRNWVLTLSQWLPLPPEELFPFFADAYNLERITPPLLRFHVLTPRPIDMRVGTLLDYQLKVHAIPIRWRTRIAGWDPPHGFIDEQLKGPYARWHHTHTFTPAPGPGSSQGHAGRPGTRCDDRVEYRPRGGPLAPMVNKLFVQRDVEAIFRYRAQVLADMFADGRCIAG